MLVMINLPKRLLSSIEALARTLRVHNKTLEKQSDQSLKPNLGPERLGLLGESVNADDERSQCW